MGIEDIQISEELETNAPSIKYSGNEGPKSPQEEKLMKIIEVLMSQGMGQEEAVQVAQQMMAADAEEKQMPQQDQRQMAAYGGIMGVETPKRGRVDGPGSYGGWGSIYQKYIKDPIEQAITGKTAIEIENESQARVDREQGINRPIPQNYDLTKYKIADITPIGDPDGTGPVESEIDTYLKGEPGTDAQGNETRTGGAQKYIIPAIGGALAGLFTKGTDPDNPGVPDDTTALQLDDLKKTVNVLDQKQAMAEGFNFTPTVASRKYSPAEMVEVYQNAANGGRIGYNMGGGAGKYSPTQMIDIYQNAQNAQNAANGGRMGYNMGGGADMGAPKMYAAEAKEMMVAEIMQKLQSPNINNQDRAILQQQLMSLSSQPQMPMMGMEGIESVGMAMGGRMGRAEGGLMDLGGMEKDYRAEGGFVPIGAKEKADDVPARLSVNEFVFTADAVRSAGGGDIDQGAQIMENMMNHLEQGGQVSEESQGMQGARDMFATSQRLGDIV